MMTESWLEQVYALLCQHRAAMARQIVLNGLNAAMSKVLACYMADDAVQEQAGGITSLRWLADLGKL